MNLSRRTLGAVVLALALSLALWGAAASAAPRRAATVERRVGLMGTELRVLVEAADRGAALAASEEAIRALEEAEGRLSTWRAASELQRVNAAPVGQPLAVSSRLAGELDSALTCAAATGGAFDPTVGALVEAWGLRRGGSRPSAAVLAAARDRTGYRELRVDDGTVTRLADVRVDEGGFGKGAALDAAAAALAAHGVRAAQLDLGGQLLLAADEDAGELPTQWLVAIADPDGRQAAALHLRVPAGSLSTSGNSERGLVVEGERIGHLLDPRSGLPAPDFGSVTVWVAAGPAAAARADCLSTGLFALGPDAALRYPERHPGIGVAVLERVGDRLRARVSGELVARVVAAAPEVQIVGTVPARTARSEDEETAGLTEGNPGPPLPRHPRGAATPPRPAGE